MNIDGTQPLLSHLTWMSLPRATRNQLAQLFTIPRSGEVVVQTGTIINGNISSVETSDGYMAKDLYAITIPKMQEILGSQETDFYKLFDGILKHLEPKSATFYPDNIHETAQAIVEGLGKPTKIELTETNGTVLPSWPQYLKSMVGKGYSMTELSVMYKELKNK